MGLIDILEFDKTKWFRDIKTIPYFDGIALLFILFIGGVSGSSVALEWVFKAGYETAEPLLWYSTGMIWLFMVAESFFGSSEYSKAFMRSLYLLGAVTGCFFIGKILSIVMIIGSLILIALYLIGIIFESMPSVCAYSGGGGGGGGGCAEEEEEMYIVDNTGSRIRATRYDQDTVTAADGGTYKKDYDGNYIRQ